LLFRRKTYYRIPPWCHRSWDYIGGTPELVGTIARIIGRNGAGKVEDLIDAGDAIISIATGFEYGNAPAENIGFGANTVASMVS